MEPTDIHSAKITFHPLHQQVNRVPIETLLQLLKTCSGPFAKLKIIRNIRGGHVSITSSSSRLFQLLSIKNTFLRLIISSIKSHLSNYGNGGIFCSLLTLVLITNSLQFSTKDLSLQINKRLSDIFLDLIQLPNNSCTFDARSFNLSYWQSIIYSIVSSKPGCYFTKQNEQDLTLLLIKSFINAFPNDVGKHFGRISFHTEEGLDPSNSKLLDGILIHLSSNHNDMCIKHCTDIVRSENNLKVAVFSTSLAGDMNFPLVSIFQSNLNIWDTVLTHLESVIMKLIDDCTNIVFCQKVIHPLLKKKLKDNHILAIDRLGTEMTSIIEQTSGAVATSCISNEINIVYGSLTSLDSVTIGKKNYLLFQNVAKPVFTVYICNSNEEALAETKVVCQQAIDTMYRLLEDGRVCCGAGCTEIYVTHLLHSFVIEHLAELSMELDCSSSQLLQSLQNFIHSVRETVLSLYPVPKISLVTEVVYGHLWELNDNSEFLKCKCEQYTSENILASQWRPLQTNPETLLSEFIFIQNSFDRSKSTKPKIMDELCIKLNSFKVAFELTFSLLNIGLVINP